MSEEQEQGTPQQRLGGDEPESEGQEAAEDTGYDSPAGQSRQQEEEFEGGPEEGGSGQSSDAW